MKRYHHDSPVSWPLLEDPNGEWVSYEDAQAEVEVLRGAGKVLVKENELLKHLIDVYQGRVTFHVEPKVGESHDQPRASTQNSGE